MLFTTTIVSAQDPYTKLEDLIPYAHSLETRVAELENLLQPASTPEAVMSTIKGTYPLISDVYKNVEKMTDIQKDKYLDELLGQEFHVIGKVSEVKKDGELYLQVASSWLSDLYLNDYPEDRLYSINKGDRVDLIGKVTDTSSFLGFTIYVDYLGDPQ